MGSVDDTLALRLLSDLNALTGGPVGPQSSLDDAETPPRPLRSMLDELAAADPDREPWPQDWLETSNSGQIDACRRLWCQVLLSCVRAALDVDGGTERATCRPVPSSWIGSRDFHMVCALAGFDGVAIAERLQSDTQLAHIRGRLASRPVQISRNLTTAVDCQARAVGGMRNGI